MKLSHSNLFYYKWREFEFSSEESIGYLIIETELILDVAGYINSVKRKYLSTYIYMGRGETITPNSDKTFLISWSLLFNWNQQALKMAIIMPKGFWQNECTFFR